MQEDNISKQKLDAFAQQLPSPKYALMQVSKRKYVIVSFLEKTNSKFNLQMFSRGEYGQQNQMMELPKAEIVTRNLNYDDAIYVLIRLTYGEGIPDDFALQP